MLHFLVERLRSLPAHILDGLLTWPFVWLAQAGVVRLWHRLHGVHSVPSNAIEMPVIESRTKVFDIGLSVDDAMRTRAFAHANA